MKSKSYSMYLSLCLSCFILLIDQWSKHVIKLNFYLYEQISVIKNFFSLTLVFNTGAAFSFLSNQSGWQRWFLAIISILMVIIMMVWLYQLEKEKKWESLSISFILGGAIGNLYDRIIHGQVVDFLLFYYRDWYFPVFNIADSAISIGAIMLIISTFKFPKKY